MDRIKLLLILLVFLVSCPNGGGENPYNSLEQPHLRPQGTNEYKTVPPVVGKWTKSPSFSIDFHIYDYPDENILVPEEDRKQCEDYLKKEWTKIHNDFLNYKTKPVKTSGQVMNEADISIKFYYGKMATVDEQIKNISSLEQKWELNYLKNTKDNLIIVNPGDKSASAFFHDQIPDWRSNYNGLAVMTIEHKVIKKVTLYMNIYMWFEMKKIYEKIEEEQGIELDFEQSVSGLLQKIGWHEMGHSYWGLGDDTDGTYPGMMVYSFMTGIPSDIEWDVVEWKDGADNV